jgi:hypothetical protein
MRDVELKDLEATEYVHKPTSYAPMTRDASISHADLALLKSMYESAHGRTLEELTELDAQGSYYSGVSVLALVLKKIDAKAFVPVSLVDLDAMIEARPTSLLLDNRYDIESSMKAVMRAPVEDLPLLASTSGVVWGPPSEGPLAGDHTATDSLKAALRGIPGGYLPDTDKPDHAILASWLLSLESL